MTKIVYIEKTEQNGIAICSDQYHGVVVQVIRFVDQLRPSGLDNALTNIRSNHVIWSKSIKIEDFKSEHYKRAVENVVQEAQAFLSTIKKMDAQIEGVLNDYMSKHKDLNSNG